VGRDCITVESARDAGEKIDSAIDKTKDAAK
jgi:hypothetical protein